MWVSKLRWSAVILGVSNVVVIILGVILIAVVYPSCGEGDSLPFLVISMVSSLRIAAMIRTAIAQRATAMLILDSSADTPIVDALIRHERRMRYKRWIWWTRFALIITVMQIAGAGYLLFSVAKHVSQDRISSICILGLVSKGTKWQLKILVIFMIMVCYVALVQCVTGSDVLKWRTFYTTEDNAWKAHYREVFDHGIRETLCCLGRVKYLTVLEEDEIYSVAQLLGDLVAYRASGTGNLELLAGLALLQRHRQSPKPCEETVDAPLDQIHEAAAFHPFAEAAYTGLLLDFGRNPVLFPFAWLHRQGVLTPWNRNRRPVLEGDNWWRGHAAAFLKHVNLTPDVLRRGRVNQEDCNGVGSRVVSTKLTILSPFKAKCEAAYFIAVLHHLKSVVIAVRGTETPEDLITDGLCRECSLTADDLEGWINGNHSHPGGSQRTVSSLPYYGHSGIVEAARDLFMQIEGNPVNDGSTSKSDGFLSSLLGAGCECDGYSVRIVGHSLGGAISALLGLRLYRQYPNLHVYAYGSLPCVDSVIANACSEFVTSIVYHDEFSARLSAASIMRLRAAAIMALSQDATADSTTIFKLAHRFLFVSDHLRSHEEENVPGSDLGSRAVTNKNISGSHHRNGCREQDEEFSLWQDMEVEDSSDNEVNCSDSPNGLTNPYDDSSADINSCDDPVSQFMEAVPSSKNGSSRDPPEMFLPGLVIHIVPQKNSFHMPLWKRWGTQEKGCSYRAYIANREAFKDILVSPSMFLDHLPWRCHYAMRKVLEMRSPQDLLDESQMV